MESDNTMGRLSASKRRNHFKQFPCCKFCGTDENLTIDHTIRPAHGGSNGGANLQTLCRSCHNKKEKIYDMIRNQLSGLKEY